MKVSQNFHLKEFVPTEIYKRFGSSSIWFIDKRVINICQFIRERFKRGVTVCNASSGGQYNYSGFDLPTGGYRKGSSLSQHKFGRAADCKLLGEENKGADMLREDVINNFSLYKKLGLTTIEDAKFSPTWLHFDIRETGMDELKIVKP